MDTAYYRRDPNSGRVVARPVASVRASPPVETWFIGPVIGAVFGAAGYLRSREASRRLAESNRSLQETNARLARIEDALVSRSVERPETIQEDRLAELGPEIATQTKERLGEAIARLPEREKLIVVLYYYEGLKMREIAEVLGVSPSRISQLHAQAVQRLKSRLAAPPEAEPPSEPFVD